MVTPKLGVKMSAADAKTYIDAVNQKVVRRWRERVTEGPFMRKFLEGALPLPAIKLFFKNWGNFTVEINTLVSVHEQADLKEHEDGVMGHGSFNKLVMLRILEDGYADTREGYNLEYCAIAAVDLYGVMHRAALELSE